MIKIEMLVENFAFEDSLWKGISHLIFMLFSFNYASQIDNLQSFLKPVKSKNSSATDSCGDINHAEKFYKLPEQADYVSSINQYAGYFTADQAAGRSPF